MLTDITLRLDALRSDDTQKREIIKNISLLKPDLERLNNGFDSIVLSLNDNFKTIIKQLLLFDKTDYFERFSDVLTGMEMSSNTILSALQMLDKRLNKLKQYFKILQPKMILHQQKNVYLNYLPRVMSSLLLLMI